jgi:hypothetical protein
VKDYPFHPLADVYPLMGGAEFEGLADDIQARGQQLPIRTWNGQIIDGRNRYRACVARGITPVLQNDSHIPEDQLEAHIASLNEHRRHLTEDFLRQKREERVTRVAEKKSAGKSTRQIAEEEKVSQTQVMADLRTATEQGYSVDPEDGKVKGRDNRTRTARPRKPRTPKAETNGVAPPAGSTGHPCPVEPEPPPPDPGTDALGIPVPEPLAPAFAAREAFARALSLRRKLAALLNELARAPGGVHLARDLTRRESGGKVSFRSTHLDDLKLVLEGNAPYSCVCPYCYDRHPGKVDPACRACHGLGWVPLHAWRHVPREEKAAVESLARKESAP